MRAQQLELFGEDKTNNLSARGVRGSFFSFSKTYEKGIVLIIVFLFTTITAFCLGVERGKRIASNNTVVFDLARKNISSETNKITTNTAPSVSTAANLNETSKPTIPSDAKDAGKEKIEPVYIIQLASFNTHTAAQREAESLKRKGLQPLIMKKGKYIVLCVGNYKDKQSAYLVLSKLKKQYQDCFIRRL